ncbi:uncharacterized protein DEA37_0003739 [Paragonimus westermani]|uniref:Major facilitator superfamily (MFS) profile domain-containing protein n=1 Tax=Paragonimus westermani TaxID=34504 RepID=A0A5J4NQ36_9TREM|nr:uncharacterized protein DEA37_0003739 [Paragonimus westermani]
MQFVKRNNVVDAAECIVETYVSSISPDERLPFTCQCLAEDLSFLLHRASVRRVTAMDRRSFFWMFIYLVVDIIAFSMVLPWLPSIFEVFSDGKVITPFIPLTVYPTGHITSTYSTFNYKIGLSPYCIGQLALEFRSPWWLVCLRCYNFCCLTHAGLVLETLLVFGSFELRHTSAATQIGCAISILMQVVSVLSYMLSAVYGSRFIWFTLSRMLCGVSRANIAVLSALVGDHSEKVARTRAMAVVGAAYSVGFTIGPLVSVLCVKRLINESVISRLIFCLGMCAAVLNTLNMLFLHWITSEPLIKKDKKQVDESDILAAVLRVIWRVHNTVTTFLTLHSLIPVSCCDNRLWQWSFVWFGYLMIFSGLEFSLSFITRTRFGYTGREQGYMFFFMGILMIIVQGGLIRRFQAGNETRFCSLETANVITHHLPCFPFLGLLYALHGHSGSWHFAAPVHILPGAVSLGFCGCHICPDIQRHDIFNHWTRSAGPHYGSIPVTERSSSCAWSCCVFFTFLDCWRFPLFLDCCRPPLCSWRQFSAHEPFFFTHLSK